MGAKHKDKKGNDSFDLRLFYRSILDLLAGELLSQQLYCYNNRNMSEKVQGQQLILGGFDNLTTV